MSNTKINSSNISCTRLYYELINKKIIIKLEEIHNKLLNKDKVFLNVRI